MYIDAVTKGIDDIPDIDPQIREKYNRMYDEKGIESLRIALKILDPKHYSSVDLKNHKRIIRALEICETTGKPYSSFLKKETRQRDFNVVKVGLNMERNNLFDRINRRVDKMMKEGFEDEARALFHNRKLNALNTVGYKELFDFFERKITLEKSVELIKRNTRRYAKRQLTWWAKDDSIRWFHPDENENILSYILNECAL